MTYTKKDIEQAREAGFKEGIKEGYAHFSFGLLIIVGIIILKIIL